MRIRCIKPEFWTHPVMARLSDYVQLLALALLCHADDEGYFMADAAIVRGACMPFRESLATISRSLAKLSDVGWIEVCESEKHGQIGHIANWEKHQKVDHARQSKIKVYFSREKFAKPRETFALDQGTGNREQGTGKGSGETQKPVATLPGQSDESQEPEKPEMTCTPEMIYEDYPRHVGKDCALKAIARALRKPSLAKAAKDAGLSDDPSVYLLRKVQNYGLYVQSNKLKFYKGGECFVPHPATWINQGRWADEEFCQWESKNA
jgi:hypothetical protein